MMKRSKQTQSRRCFFSSFNYTNIKYHQRLLCQPWSKKGDFFSLEFGPRSTSPSIITHHRLRLIPDPSTDDTSVDRTTHMKKNKTKCDLFLWKRQVWQCLPHITSARILNSLFWRQTVTSMTRRRMILPSFLPLCHLLSILSSSASSVGFVLIEGRIVSLIFHRSLRWWKAFDWLFTPAAAEQQPKQEIHLYLFNVSPSLLGFFSAFHSCFLTSAPPSENNHNTENSGRRCVCVVGCKTVEVLQHAAWQWRNLKLSACVFDLHGGGSEGSWLVSRSLSQFLWLDAGLQGRWMGSEVKGTQSREKCLTAGAAFQTNRPKPKENQRVPLCNR